MAGQANQKPGTKPLAGGARIKSGKNSLSSNIFNLIMEYRDSKIYKWINLHPEVSIAIVGFWGMLIIIMFLWFVIARMVG
jgi:hypothetical protein